MWCEHTEFILWSIIGNQNNVVTGSLLQQCADFIVFNCSVSRGKAFAKSILVIIRDCLYFISCILLCFSNPMSLLKRFIYKHTLKNIIAFERSCRKIRGKYLQYWINVFVCFYSLHYAVLFVFNVEQFFKSTKYVSTV